MLVPLVQGSSTTPSSTPPKYSINFTVLTSQSHAAVPKATITQYNCGSSFPGGPPAPCWVFTANESGFFSTESFGVTWPNGTYYFQVNATGYTAIPQSSISVVVAGRAATATPLLKSGAGNYYATEFHLVDYFKRINVQSMFCEYVLSPFPTGYPCKTYTDAGGTFTETGNATSACLFCDIFLNATGYHNATRWNLGAGEVNANVTIYLIWSNVTQSTLTVRVLNASNLPVSSALVTLIASEPYPGSWSLITGAAGTVNLSVYSIVNYSLLAVDAGSAYNAYTAPIGNITGNTVITVHLTNATTNSTLLGTISQILSNPWIEVGLAIVVAAITLTSIVLHARLKKAKGRKRK